METNRKYDELNAKALRYFKNSGLMRIAVAVSGSEESLILLNAAVQAFGNENVLAVTADTGSIPENVLRIIRKACDMTETELSIVPVFADGADDYDYKCEIFGAMLHECWFLGFDTLSCGCTEENADIGGNACINAFDGIISPFICE